MNLSYLAGSATACLFARIEQRNGRLFDSYLDGRQFSVLDGDFGGERAEDAQEKDVGFFESHFMRLSGMALKCKNVVELGEENLAKAIDTNPQER